MSAIVLVIPWFGKFSSVVVLALQAVVGALVYFSYLMARKDDFVMQVVYKIVKSVPK